ncbi:NAD(P)-dependent oxidoreductase [Streptomyces sp. NPDC006140]|uniref:NAD(P)-dependent oxidoreductase n=1 Tax=Streptomyces sp. NPDC006140 TaxID=3154579 RepID=UPI0033F25092
MNRIPATDETHGFFDQTAFEACGPETIFLNLGRASTVDHAALLDALDTGR